MSGDDRQNSPSISRQNRPSATIEIENCKSNPKFETVALISKEMRISLDAVVFHDEKPREIPKVVADFFAGKSDAEAERYIALCQSAEKLKNGE